MVGAGRAGVHGRRGQPAYLIEQVRLGVMGKVMRLDHRQVGRDRDVDLGAQACARSSGSAAHGHRRCQSTLVTAAVAWSTRPGSTASINRAPTWRTAERSTPRIATVITSPMIGSACRQPNATPAAPSSTARLVNPSVRACRPSATSAALPIRRPTRIR